MTFLGSHLAFSVTVELIETSLGTNTQTTKAINLILKLVMLYNTCMSPFLCDLLIQLSCIFNKNQIQPKIQHLPFMPSALLMSAQSF